MADFWAGASFSNTSSSSEVVAPEDVSLAVASSVVLAGVVTFLFTLMGFLAYRQYRKSRADLGHPDGEPVSAAGAETRLLFMGMLALSNFSRAVSLCVEVLTQQDRQLLQRSVRTWVRDFLMCVPTLLFLSTYSVVILFWAQVYYASVLVSFPLLKPVVVFINIAAYVVFSVIACLTLLLMAYAEFRQYLYFLLGILFLLCATYFFYFGVKVSAQLLDRNKQLSRKSLIIRRVVILTCTVPFVLFLKGIYCSAVGLGFVSLSAPWNLSRLTWDSSNFFVSEFIPSLLMLCVFWPGRPRADAYEPIPSSLLSSSKQEEGTLHSLESPLISQRHSHLAEARKRLESIRVREPVGPQQIQAEPKKLVGGSRES